MSVFFSCKKGEYRQYYSHVEIYGEQWVKASPIRSGSEGSSRNE